MRKGKGVAWTAVSFDPGEDGENDTDELDDEYPPFDQGMMRIGLMDGEQQGEQQGEGDKVDGEVGSIEDEQHDEGNTDYREHHDRRFGSHALPQINGKAGECVNE